MINKERANKIIYAIGTNADLDEASCYAHNVSAATKRPFKLYIGGAKEEEGEVRGEAKRGVRGEVRGGIKGEVKIEDVSALRNEQKMRLNPIEQERRKTGHDKTSFVVKKEVQIRRQDIMVCFPLACMISGNKMTVPEDEMRRILTDFKKLHQPDEPEESDISDLSCDKSEKGVEGRGRGRPKGSKNRKPNNDEESSDEEYENSQFKKEAKKLSKGRPKGSKNRRKDTCDEFMSEFNFHSLFKKVFQHRSFEEINKRMNREKHQTRQEKREEILEEQQGTRKRGRPKGRTNKKKIEEEDSEQGLKYEIPERMNIEQLQKIECCSKCSQRKNKKLYLEGKLKDKSVLRNIAENIGVENTTNLIINAIRNERPDILKELLGLVGNIQNDFLVPWDCNSRLENPGYTIRTRKDFVKKQKEMINAMLQDRYVYKGRWWEVVGLERIIQNMPHYEAGIQIYKILVEVEPQLEEVFYQHIPSVARCGNHPLTYFLLTRLLADHPQQNQSIYGYSKEHLECLNKERSELNFKKAVMLKQNCTSDFFSPIHCSVINPNTELLSYIIRHISEFNVGDSEGRKPIHYAATLESPKAMQIILKHGGDLKDIDKKKMTALMIAAEHGKYKIIKFILEKVREKEYLNFKGEEELSALHYATINKHPECISLLLEDPLVNKYEETKEKFTIFHLAAGGGDKDIIKLILASGVKSTCDNFRRSPLVIAARNHHNDIFFYLLKHSDVSFKKDYSNNTMLHYAAAYGNIELVIYLNNVMDQIPNKKNFYPWEIAVLKGHHYCAHILESKAINFPHHHHLIYLLLRNPRGTFEYVRMLKYLLSTNIYSLDYQYNEVGDTCLHLLCSLGQKEYNLQRSKQTSEMQANEYEDMQRTIINLFLDNGANENILNEQGIKPVKLCIEHENLIGIQLLLREIPFEVSNPIKNNNFAYYLTKIACRGANEMEWVHSKLAEEDDRTLKIELRKSDCQGFEFLVFLIKNFTQSVHSSFHKNYVNFLKSIPGRDEQDADTQKNAIMEAYREYCEHEASLLRLVNFLVLKGSDPLSTVLEPKVEEEKENYKKWGIQHFLMRFPSLVLLKAFMKWIDKSFNMQNSEGRTPLHLFCMWNREGSLFNAQHSQASLIPPIDFRISENYEGKKSLEYLLENGLNCNTWDINRSTPLLYAALNGQLKFINLLRMYGSSINNCNLLNQVPLIELIKSKHKFTLKEMIQEVESIFEENRVSDICDLDDRNALHHLVSDATNFDTSPEICKKLLEYGVKINSTDKYGRSPIFYCFIRIRDNGLHETKQQERNNDKVEILQKLLNCDDIDLNVTDIYDKTPLHYACEKNFFFSILYLLDTHINYDVKDREGNTPVAICLKHRNLNQAALLIRKGVKYGYVIANGRSYSYFEYAVNELLVGICFMLLDHGYPLQKALEEVKSESFKRILLKKYD